MCHEEDGFAIVLATLLLEIRVDAGSDVEEGFPLRIASEVAMLFDPVRLRIPQQSLTGTEVHLDELGSLHRCRCTRALLCGDDLCRRLLRPAER